MGPGEVSVPKRKQTICRGPPSPYVAEVKLEFWHHGIFFSMVPDVENYALGTRRTLCTKADSGIVSGCTDSARSDHDCQDLWAQLDDMAAVLPHLPTFVGQSASVTVERHRHSHQLPSGVPSASV